LDTWNPLAREHSKATRRGVRNFMVVVDLCLDLSRSCCGGITREPKKDAEMISLFHSESFL
jgi:hypothetical protein